MQVAVIISSTQGWPRPAPLTVQGGVAAVLVFTLPWCVPAAVLTLPPLGFLNFHLTPLPSYRGPEPLFWLLHNGEAAGAVTVHRMDADTGPVLLAEPVPLGPALTPQSQDATQARYWPRTTLADVCVRWAEPALALDRLVRAANPWNRGALATLRGQALRVLGTPTLTPAWCCPALCCWPRPLRACGWRAAREALRLDVVALEEGYFTGLQLM